MSALLEMKQITVRFPGVLANDNVDLDLEAGEVLALVGENGAGKSTLIKVLAGENVPETGTVTSNRASFRTIRQREAAEKAELRCQPIPRSRQWPLS